MGRRSRARAGGGCERSVRLQRGELSRDLVEATLELGDLGVLRLRLVLEVLDLASLPRVLRGDRLEGLHQDRVRGGRVSDRGRRASDRLIVLLLLPVQPEAADVSDGD